MLLSREVVLAPRLSDRFPSADSCLRVGFFFAFLPLPTSTTLATSDRRELNTAHTLRYYTGYRLRTSDLYIIQLKVVGTAVHIFASGPQLHPIFCL